MKSFRFPYFSPTLAIVTFALSCIIFGCTGPRAFQSTVPPPIVKSPEQIEAERQGADLLAQTLQEPAELKPVALALSASLGAPKKSLVEVKILNGVNTFDVPKASAVAVHNLQKALVQMQGQRDALNAKLTKLQGKEIEGTGFSLLGPGLLTTVIIICVIAVVCPGAMTAMWFVMRRLKAAASIVVNKMEAASKDPETKDAIAKVKKDIEADMIAHPQKTTLLRDVITNLKK